MGGENERVNESQRKSTEVDRRHIGARGRVENAQRERERE